MSPETSSEHCVRRFLDVQRFYVQSDVRMDVQKVVVPYIRYGNLESDVMEFLAPLVNSGKIRNGFFKLLRDLRLGDSEAQCLYDKEFK